MNVLIRKAAEKAAKEVGQGVYGKKGEEVIVDATKKVNKKLQLFVDENKENLHNAANVMKQPLSIDTFERYNKSPLISPTTPPKFYLGGVRRKTQRRRKGAKKRRTIRRKNTIRRKKHYKK